MTRVVVSPETLVREVDGEAVLLSLVTGHYYGLDESSALMWRAVTTAPSLDAAIEQLLAEFDVDAATLRRDLEVWLEELRAEGLIELS